VKLLRCARGKLFVIGSLIVANIVLYAWISADPARDEFRITFLDVGQGDAAFLEFPGGGTVLIDAGPKTPGYDTGERVILPFLRWKGVQKIDYLVVSHPHSDHLGGVPAVMRAIAVGRVVDCGSEEDTRLYKEYSRVMDSLRLPMSPAVAGEILGDELPGRIYVLWPDTGFAGPGGSPGFGGARSNVNNLSVVLDIRFGSTSVLFTGDAEDDAEAYIVARYGGFIGSGLLKAGHHGSITSSTPGFISLVSPEHTVISVGRGNRFGHPSAAVIDRYLALGSEVERTDLEGALVFESDGRRWDRVRWR